MIKPTIESHPHLRWLSVDAMNALDTNLVGDRTSRWYKANGNLVVKTLRHASAKVVFVLPCKVAAPEHCHSGRMHALDESVAFKHQHAKKLV